MTRISVNKRFEFSASHRYFQPEWTKEKNKAVFGEKFEGEFGHGHNYQVFLVFSGDLDPRDGMLINFFEIKSQIKDRIKEKYDHKFLNEDISRFKTVVPTSENIAKCLLEDARTWFESERARPIACHLIESNVIEATAYEDGSVERHMWETFNVPFSHPDDPSIRILTPIQMRITLGGQHEPESGRLEGAEHFKDELAAFIEEINSCDPIMPADPSTSVPFAFPEYCLERFSKGVAINRIKIQEIGGNFIEYYRDGTYAEGLMGTFYAAHRLENKNLSEAENKELFGKCYSLHGHQYSVELTVSSGKHRNTTLRDIFQNTLKQWNYKSLDLETDDFKHVVSTTEQMTLQLFNKLQHELGNIVDRVRINETANNRVTVRRDSFT